MEDIKQIILNEVSSLKNILDEKYISKEMISNFATKEELEKLAEDIARVKMLQNSSFVKDTKKEMAETIRKALTTGSQNAQYTIPEEVATQVMGLVNIYGIARKISNVIQVSTASMKIPVEGQVSTYWVGEGVEITETNPNTIIGSGVIVSPKKLAGYVEVSKEMLKYANISVIDYLLNIFAKQIAKEEDRIFLKGQTSGGDPFNGITTMSPEDSIVLSSGNTSWNSITVDHLILLQSKVHYSVLESPDAVYILHPHLYAMLLSQKSTGSGEYIAGTYLDPNTRTFLGKKIVLSDQMPANQPGQVAVVFGDFKMANIFAVAQEMTIETSLEYGFKKDVVAVKITEWVAPVNVGLLNAYSYVRLASS